MPDLLTHVLVPYALVTLLGLRYDSLGPPFAAAAMVGGAIPDLNRLALVLPAHRVEALSARVLDVLPDVPLLPGRLPIDWDAIHTLPGSLTVAAIVALLVPARYRRRTFACLALGVTVHHGLDVLLVSTSGRAYDVFWPLLSYSPPTPGLYSSRDPELAALAIALAGAAWFLRYHDWSPLVERECGRH